MGQDKKKSVFVSNEAAVSIVLHAVKHAHHPVHGVLLGSFEDGGAKINVKEAVPVCHGAPTLPLVESALSLIEAINKKAVIVGWYVSPRLHKDDRPGPAALKIVSGLAVDSSGSNEPVLLVLGNEHLDKVLQGDQSALENSMKALGKDFGKQWLDPLGIEVGCLEPTDRVAVKESLEDGKTTTMDLEDHFEGDPKSTWYTPPLK